MQLIRLTRIFFTYVVMSWHFCAMPSYSILDLPDELLISIYDLLYYKQMEQFTASYNPEDPQEYQLFLLHYYCFIIHDKSENSFKNLNNVNKRLHRLYSTKRKQLENTKFDPLILYQYCKKNNLGRSPFNSDDVCYIQYDGFTQRSINILPFCTYFKQKVVDTHFNIEYCLNYNGQWLISCTIKSNYPPKFVYKNLSEKNALAFLIQYIGTDTVLESIYPYLSRDNKDIEHRVRFSYTFNPIKRWLDIIDKPPILEKLATIEVFVRIPIIKEVPPNVVYNIFHKLSDSNKALPPKNNFLKNIFRQICPT